MTRTRSQVAQAQARAQVQNPPSPTNNPHTSTTPTHTPLYLLVASENWPAVEARCLTHPSEASSLTPTENLTPLHVACLCDPPPSAVSALLKAHPAASGSRTSTGLVPLHFACIKSSPEVVRLLIEADVDSVKCRSSSKRVTPLSLLCNKYYHLVKDLKTSGGGEKEDGGEDDDEATERDLEANPELKRVWMIGCMLVKAAYHGEATPSLGTAAASGAGSSRSRLVPDWNVLRACAGMEECCWLFVTLCLKLRTDWVFDADEFGNLPLHTAAASPYSPNPEKITAIDVLTTVYPDGCRVRNAEGKLPLHLALESGKRWDGGVSAIHIGWRGAAVVAEPPADAEMPADERGLYPFMRAAVARPAARCRRGRKRAAERAGNNNGGGDLDAIYHLLRDCPELERFAADAAERAPRVVGRGGAKKRRRKCGQGDDEGAVVVAEQVRDPKTRRRHVHVFVEGGDGTRRLRTPKIPTAAAVAESKKKMGDAAPKRRRAAQTPTPSGGAARVAKRARGVGSCGGGDVGLRITRSMAARVTRSMAVAGR